MSYRSLIKSLPSTLRTLLRQPTYAAGLASVGIHGLLWFVLPLLPLNSSTPTEPEIQRTVSLVELSPAEQSRLPDFSTPQVTLPTAPDPSPDLYSLSPLPNSFSPIPTQPSTPSYPTFPSIPSFLPPPPPFTLPPSYSLPRRPQTPPRNPVQSPPTPTPSGSPTPTPSTQAVNPETNSSPNGSPSASPSPQPSNEQQQSTLQARIAQGQALLNYNPRGTTNQEAGRTFAAWFQEALEIVGDDWNEDRPESIPLNAPYPVAGCPRRLQGTVVVGVVVASDGKVLDELEPIVLQSSGYELFNQRALALVKAHEFESTGKKKALLVNVQFSPSSQSCSFAPSPSSSPSPESSG